MRMSMMRPMPFWPSLEPWKKLTPVQVTMSRTRIQKGGGSLPLGASYNCLLGISFLLTSRRSAANTNPTIGERISDFPIVVAWAQSTPLVPVFTDINWLAMPTPMIEPIRVCELDEGSPNHQVPRFQMIAATRSAKTIAKPALPPTCKINSTGSSETMLKATAPLEARTPRKFHAPDQTTATCGSMVCV